MFQNCAGGGWIVKPYLGRGRKPKPPRQVPGRKVAGFQLAPCGFVQTPLRNMESAAITTVDGREAKPLLGVSLVFRSRRKGICSAAPPTRWRGKFTAGSLSESSRLQLNFKPFKARTAASLRSETAYG